MSGGHFDYNQYRIGYIADSIEQLIRNNKTDEYPYSDEIIAKFKEGIKALRIAEVYAQRIDWLVSGDDGDESFMKRLAEDLALTEGGEG